MAKKEAYIIWDGPNAGIYISWEECRPFIIGQPVRHNSFKDYEFARKAFAWGYDEYVRVINEPPKVFPDLF
ncbi:MAG: RNase H1/viroplasmin domain-containing protein [Sphingobacteriales bacterium JAD_PAG50586_3]|nr:MAG: RNase H1/viroplasmin domain-containing protein [Sphingobacteriales bacterium JAD_PAG50586_3]